MKHEDDRSLSVSPPLNMMQHPGLYANFNPQAAASAMGMLAPQLLAANQSAAAALMAWPMQLRAQLASAANGLFPHHAGLFGAWPTTPPLSSNSATSPPPPASPISPALSSKSSKSNNKLNNNYTQLNNNHIVSTTSDLMPVKKATKRKQLSKMIIKKELLDTMLMNNNNNHHNDHNLLGSISPPTSGSSPQSNNSMELSSVITTTSTTPKDPTKDKIFTCKICNRSFGYKHVLQNHERTHTGEKPFECPECHKRFTRDHHLKTHMRLHTGEKPYSCSHCDRQFVQVANLRRHLRVHTGERPYSCEICLSRFSDSNQLKAHNLIHNGEKPFECDRCHTKFRRRHHLMHHKCGIQSPPTPAVSPTMSYSDHKSHSSELSDESLDLNKTHLHLQKCHQLLDTLKASSVNGALNLSTDVNGEFMDTFRARKSSDLLRLMRMPSQIVHIQTAQPEQTEPEDLSMHSPRSPVSFEDLEELDDAASLYLKSQRKLHHRQTMES